MVVLYTPVSVFIVLCMTTGPCSRPVLSYSLQLTETFPTWIRDGWQSVQHTSSTTHQLCSYKLNSFTNQCLLSVL